MIQLQHTPKTSETIERYNCNIGGERACTESAMAARSEGVRSSLWGKTLMSGRGTGVGRRKPGWGRRTPGWRKKPPGWERRTLRSVKEPPVWGEEDAEVGEGVCRGG